MAEEHKCSHKQEMAGAPGGCAASHGSGTGDLDEFLEQQALAPILALSNNGKPQETETATNEGEKTSMRIAIPVADGKLAMHFGHCEQFALLDADGSTWEVTGKQMVTPPPHEPGVLPRWLHEQGATVIIAGGMGQRAQTLFAENGIKVVVGAPSEPPEALAASYLAGTLISGDNVCDH